MFTKRNYKCYCHVCGREFEHESEFFATNTIKVMPDGTERLVCTCNVNPPYNTHTQEEIRASWLCYITG
jgi:hypothetical protein